MVSAGEDEKPAEEAAAEAPAEPEGKTDSGINRT